MAPTPPNTSTAVTNSRSASAATAAAPRAESKDLASTTERVCLDDATRPVLTRAPDMTAAVRIAGGHRQFATQTLFPTSATLRLRYCIAERMGQSVERHVRDCVRGSSRRKCPSWRKLRYRRAASSSVWTPRSR